MKTEAGKREEAGQQPGPKVPEAASFPMSRISFVKQDAANQKAAAFFSFFSGSVGAARDN